MENKPQVSGKNLLITIVLNVVITVAQAIGGVLSGSLALLSDALHNFSDVLSLVFSLIANRLATKEANFNQTFGYKRAELIAAFVNAATLIVVALYLIYEAFLRYLHPQVINSDLVIVLSIVGIVANGLSVLILKKDADRNLNMKSAYLHLFTDGRDSGQHDALSCLKLREEHMHGPETIATGISTSPISGWSGTRPVGGAR